MLFFSRVWIKPLKTKHAEGVISALTEVLAEIPVANFATDRGSEYKNKAFRKFLKEHDVRWTPKVG